MTVFEEFVEELKDENLLETAITTARPVVSAAEPNATILVPPDNAPVDDAHKAPAEDPSGFYRQRALADVATLQMVEHLLMGIEREYVKVVPAIYNDLAVKKALHYFLRVEADPESREHLDAEGAFIREVDAWRRELANRDREISVANLRRFCENSRPALSSQALIALARFYSSVTFTEAVRGKFDFVMTRLFSRDTEGETRRLIFAKLDMIRHIAELLDEWEFVPPATTAVAETLVQFRQAIDEAEAAATFDELLKADFFNRVRAIKQDAGQAFFTPEVTAAAIEANTHIGNCFVRLLQLEKANASGESLEEKYGYSYDSLISGTTSKTVRLAELLRMEELSVTDDEAHERSRKNAIYVSATSNTERGESKNAAFSFFGINRWLIGLSTAALVVTGLAYFWSENASGRSTGIVTATEVSLSDSGLGETLQLARGSNETVYAVVKPAWDLMSEEARREFLMKAETFAKAKGYKRLNLLDKKGKTIGFATEDGIDLINP